MALPQHFLQEECGLSPWGSPGLSRPGAFARVASRRSLPVAVVLRLDPVASLGARALAPLALGQDRGCRSQSSTIEVGDSGSFISVSVAHN